MRELLTAGQSRRRKPFLIRELDQSPGRLYLAVPYRTAATPVTCTPSVGQNGLSSMGSC